ncbi:hypothetical protein BDZ97DRAFT_1925145 [Flammula alnicola]|nr:hypothetical protein BDZ97DRAFT_1925145 [Flammula alnicola]
MKSWRVGLTRLELTAWTIIAPEITICWAMRQWVGARLLAEKYQDNGWTKTHGYFLQMGGFMLYRNDVMQGVLSPESLEGLTREGKIKVPAIMEEEIQDRSKGDAISKMLVIVQTMWFVAQCITRPAQGLATTELELITLGFAVLNGFMYFSGGTSHSTYAGLSAGVADPR